MRPIAGESEDRARLFHRGDLVPVDAEPIEDGLRVFAELGGEDPDGDQGAEPAGGRAQAAILLPTTHGRWRAAPSTTHGRWRYTKEITP